MYRILSTRRLDQGVVRYAASQGLEVHCLDFIEIKDIAFDTTVFHQNFDGLVFTSGNAVVSFFHNEHSRSLVKDKKIFSTSGRTKEELIARGIKIDATGDNADKLAQSIIEEGKEKNIL